MTRAGQTGRQAEEEESGKWGEKERGKRARKSSSA